MEAGSSAMERGAETTRICHHGEGNVRRGYFAVVSVEGIRPSKPLVCDASFGAAPISTKPWALPTFHLSKLLPAMNTALRLAALATLGLVSSTYAEVKVVTKRVDGGGATPAFAIPAVPSPRADDLAAKAELSLVDGERDSNGGELAALTDGALPKSGDDPRANFFFAAGTDGGRLLLDLGSSIDVKQVNSYSWHRGSRGPQVYKLYASDGKAADFSAQPKRPNDPTKAGWKLVASVDTRSDNAGGGQIGVSIADVAGSLGQFRYLLFDVNRTEDRDTFGNTFFSEIDVLDKIAPANAEVPVTEQVLKSVEIEGGARFTVETTDAPDLTDWSNKELIPVVQQWYPKIVAMLPSEGYTAPRTFSINFTNEYTGVAATAGTRVMCSPPWYRKQLKGEAVGSVVHELCHVVQQYGRVPRGGNRPPGWLVEGMCDYIRWYLYEPQSHGADLRPAQANDARIKYDGSYRITANFMNFVITKYDKDLLREVNAAMRQGKYTPEFWKTRTGKSVEDLAAEWKKAIEAGEAMAKKSAS